MKRSRRRFLKLMAAGSAAAAVAPAASLAQTARRVRPSRRPAGRTVPPAVAAEIQKQKGYTAKALEAIRAHALDNGAEQAFVFTPLAAPRRRGR